MVLLQTCFKWDTQEGIENNYNFDILFVDFK